MNIWISLFLFLGVEQRNLTSIVDKAKLAGWKGKLLHWLLCFLKSTRNTARKGKERKGGQRSCWWLADRSAKKINSEGHCFLGEPNGMSKLYNKKKKNIIQINYTHNYFIKKLIKSCINIYIYFFPYITFYSLILHISFLLQKN